MAILYDWVSVKRENVGLHGKLFTIYTNELKYQEKSLISFSKVCFCTCKHPINTRNKEILGLFM